MNACGASESNRSLSFFDMGQTSREWACDTLVFFLLMLNLKLMYVYINRNIENILHGIILWNSWYYLYNKYLLSAFYTPLFTVLYLAIESSFKKYKQTDRHRHIYYIFTDCRFSVSYLCLNVFILRLSLSWVTLWLFDILIWSTYFFFFCILSTCGMTLK